VPYSAKPGGLIVDYLGPADQLKRALATYTESGGQGNPTYDTKQPIAENGRGQSLLLIRARGSFTTGLMFFVGERGQRLNCELPDGELAAGDGEWRDRSVWNFPTPAFV